MPSPTEQWAWASIRPCHRDARPQGVSMIQTVCLFTALATTVAKTTEMEPTATLPALVTLPTLAPETTQPACPR